MWRKTVENAPMLIGLHSQLFRGPPEAVAAKLSDAGCNCIQLAPGFPGLDFHQPGDFKPERCRRAAAAFHLANIQIAVLSMTGALPETDLARRLATVIRWHALIRHAQFFGAKYVVIESAVPGPTDIEEKHRELVGILALGLHVARDSDISLLVKPAVGHLIATSRDVLRLRNDLPGPNLGFVMDVTTFLAEGQANGSATDPTELCRQVGQWTPVIHLKVPDLERRRRLDAGSGSSDLSAFIRAHRLYQPEAPIILESVRPENASTAVRHVRDVLATS
jgi:sugar phosphate isomerase/epimerase